MPLSLESVQTLVKRLDKAGIQYASGGSGLLYSLGLTDQVHDWDLTTDTPYEAVSAALQGWSWTVSTSGDHPFASSYRITVQDETLPVDIIGRFAFHCESGICRLPALPSFEWQGICMGSPEIWAAAYTLMDRRTKADKLFVYLQQNGANPDAIQTLLAEPMPNTLRIKMSALL